jgi:hypothetical protein
VQKYGNTDDFVGHVGGDDFVIVTTPDRAETLCRHILTQYREESAVLYKKEDLERGSIIGVDRNGFPYQFPLVSLSIGVVTNLVRSAPTTGEIGALAAEAKRRAKLSPDNVCYLSPSHNTFCQHYPHSAHSSSLLSYPDFPSFHAVDSPYGDFFSLTQEDALAEFN